MENTYIRAAIPDDFNRIVDAGVRSMKNDPLLAYFGCTKPASLRAYLLFTLNSCWLVGGTIDLVCTFSKDQETILAVGIWMAPRKRVNSWDVITVLRAGVVSLGNEVGVQGLLRIGCEFPAVVGKSWKQSQYCLLDGAKWSSDSTWYLKLAFTEPAYQRHGIMTKLLREPFGRFEGEGWTLEATTPKARDFFSQLGFEILHRSRVGSGAFDNSGNEEPGGTGFEVFSMLKRNLDSRTK